MDYKRVVRLKLDAAAHRANLDRRLRPKGAWVEGVLTIVAMELYEDYEAVHRLEEAAVLRWQNLMEVARIYGTANLDPEGSAQIQKIFIGRVVPLSVQEEKYRTDPLAFEMISAAGKRIREDIDVLFPGAT